MVAGCVTCDCEERVGICSRAGTCHCEKGGIGGGRREGRKVVCRTSAFLKYNVDVVGEQ